MKPKVLKKWLVLNKKTIADLDESAMGDMYGGRNVPYTGISGCISCDTICRTCGPDSVCLCIAPILPTMVDC